MAGLAPMQGPSNSDLALVGFRSTALGGLVRKIEVGQRFKKTSPPGTVWEVIAEVSDLGGIRHLRVRDLDDPTTVKLLSEYILSNERLYRLVSE
jgi:hypothetical protein